MCVCVFVTCSPPHTEHVCNIPQAAVSHFSWACPCWQVLVFLGSMMLLKTAGISSGRPSSPHQHTHPLPTVNSSDKPLYHPFLQGGFGLFSTRPMPHSSLPGPWLWMKASSVFLPGRECSQWSQRPQCLLGPIPLGSGKSDQQGLKLGRQSRD